MARLITTHPQIVPRELPRRRGPLAPPHGEPGGEDAESEGYIHPNQEKLRGGLSLGKIAKELQQIGLACLVVAPVLVIVVVLIAVQMLFFQQTGFVAALTTALVYTFLGVALFVVVGPTLLKLYREDLKNTGTPDAEEWSTRLRTLITVAMTIVLLVFVLVWATNPEIMETQGGAQDGAAQAANQTANSSLQLRPFVRAFFDAFMVVIAFYFPTAAAESILKNRQNGGGSGGGGSGGGGSGSGGSGSGGSGSGGV